MPSFDIVSEYDAHEVANAVDQANREVGTRFDFKGSNANYQISGDTITLHAGGEFQIQQMRDILYGRLTKRGVDIACAETGDVRATDKTATQTITLRQGLTTDISRQVVKLIKTRKLKVQASIQGEKVRVTGKKRDDLQQVIAMLREESLDMPLQFNNFRD
ncbi:MAG TPA: YajQ family cyclic di-GMP-binding protein [Gammaproteobacteria bacterium]|nr:YajQ family cyclic di-GMP-binding protein [Gammaproteobacteria bacterium]